MELLVLWAPGTQQSLINGGSGGGGLFSELEAYDTEPQRNPQEHNVENS